MATHCWFVRELGNPLDLTLIWLCNRMELLVNWAITLAAEIVAVALVMRYWFPDVPSWVWSAVFLTVLFLINAFTVK